MSRLFLDVAEYWPACGWEAAIVLPVFLVVRAGLLLSPIKCLALSPRSPRTLTLPPLSRLLAWGQGGRDVFLSAGLNHDSTRQ